MFTLPNLKHHLVVFSRFDHIDKHCFGIVIYYQLCQCHLYIYIDTLHYHTEHTTCTKTRRHKTSHFSDSRGLNDPVLQVNSVLMQCYLSFCCIYYKQKNDALTPSMSSFFSFPFFSFVLYLYYLFIASTIFDHFDAIYLRE